LADWITTASCNVGLQVDLVEVDKSVRLRVDDKIQRLLLLSCTDAPTLTMGFSVQDSQSLDQLMQTLQGAGVEWTAGSSNELKLRGVSGMIHFKDPDGNRVEAAYGLRDASTAFTPSRPIGGFRTGDLGLGHVALKAGLYDEMIAFYRGLLQFRLSDRASKPFKAEFLHVNARHHTLGLADTGTGPGVYHLMLEYNDFDDVGRSYDLALEKPESIGVSLGRHINDHVTSFYLKTPDGWMLELGWAGRTIGADWKVEDLPGLSLWGHDRTWLPPDIRENARHILKELSAQGGRAPIHLPPKP
jgi:2,3-dihydroxybiphenyl 1,2-dioxygenase